MQRGSHHQQLWGSNLKLKKQRIPSDWMRETQPSLPQWQALHRCPHGQPCQKTSPVSLASVTYHPCQPCWKHLPHPTAPGSPSVSPARLPDEVLWLQGQMNMALEWLLTTKATIDSHCRELELNAKLAVCMNEAQAVKAIKETEVVHASATKEAKVHHAAMTKEAKVHHAAMIRRLKCAMQMQSKKLRCTAQPGSKRLRCTMQPLPVSYNKLTGSVRQRQKRAGITKPLWRPPGQPPWAYSPKTHGPWCTPYNSWPVMCH